MSALSSFRARRASLGLPDSSRRNLAPQRPFVGCDGEGAGVDALGRQDYLLLRMGEHEIFTGSRLTSYQCLDFICSVPAGPIYVGFSFGYDVTMILRDLPEGQLRRLFAPRQAGPGRSSYVWYKDFDIEYLPRNYLKVRRSRTVRQPDGTEKRVPVAGSVRIIYETFGFFQKSFLKVCEEFKVGTPAELETLAQNKARRGEFVEMTEEERTYCALECRLLAELMEKLRGYCYDAEIRPNTWSGAGKLAAALHLRHGTMQRESVGLLPAGLRDFANLAYYGGRFEITATGHVAQPVWEYDLRSAYPAAMLRLPCLACGTWREVSGPELRKAPVGSLYVSSVRFRADGLGAKQYGRLGAFPVRSKEGHLYWPLEGNGVYWSPEIESAAALGIRVTLGGGWLFEPRCRHRPFSWVNELYEYRRSIGSQGAGYPIKLGINSLYGKLAQRMGNGRYHNMVWAGLITAYTRAALNLGASQAPRSIVMLATDALLSLEELPGLVLSEELGGWEDKRLEDLFIVQPGLYWSSSKAKKKSRGLSGKFFEEAGRTESFEHAWRRYAEGEASVAGGTGSDFPGVPVPVPGFIGLRLALSRNKPQTAGSWVSEDRTISYDWRNKRGGAVRWERGAGGGIHARTPPKPGGRSVVSLPHRDFLAAGGAEPWERSRMMMDEQPDFVDLSPPWKD